MSVERFVVPADSVVTAYIRQSVSVNDNLGLREVVLAADLPAIVRAEVERALRWAINTTPENDSPASRAFVASYCEVRFGAEPETVAGFGPTSWAANGYKTPEPMTVPEADAEAKRKWGKEARAHRAMAGNAVVYDGVRPAFLGDTFEAAFHAAEQGKPGVPEVVALPALGRCAACACPRCTALRDLLLALAKREACLSGDLVAYTAAENEVRDAARRVMKDTK